MPQGRLGVKLLLLLKLLLEGLEDEQSNDTDEDQCQALQRCRVSKPNTNKLGEYVNKEYIVQRTCTEVYKVKADSVEQAEEFIANNPSEFSMIGGETIDIEVEE